MPFEFHARTRVVFGAGEVARVGTLAAELGRRALLVADPGIVSAGYAARVAERLEAAGVRVVPFHDFGENPDSTMVARGRDAAAPHGIDFIVAVGGGSSMDCAKGINFLLTNGGAMADYQGFGKATKPMLPSIGVPTTAGTGSEAQSYALIADEKTHLKMACGDRKAAFRVAHPRPRGDRLAAADGHGRHRHRRRLARGRVVRLARGATRSRECSRARRGGCWRRTSSACCADPDDLEARAAHAARRAPGRAWPSRTRCSARPRLRQPADGPLRHDARHRRRLLLPHVVRFNSRVVGDRYAELAGVRGEARRPEALVVRLEDFVAADEFPAGLRAAGVPERDLPDLATAAAQQWTGTFNPRAFDVAGALEIYAAAY